MNYTPIFKSEENQMLFEKQGFVVIPMLDIKGLKTLDVIFNDLNKILPKEGFFSGGYSADLEYKRNSSNRISEVMEPYVDKLLTNYKVYGSTFVYKMPTRNSELGPHQDWTIVDEDNYFSLNCWVPLTDITRQNGPMYVLPGSHFINHKVIRAPSMGYYYDNYRNTVLKYMVPMLVKAGTAVIINHSIIHYSSPNYSKEIRKALITAVKSKDAQTILYFDKKENEELEIYEMAEDFAIQYQDFFTDNKKKPNGRYLRTVKNENREYTNQELNILFRQMLKRSNYFSNDFHLRLNTLRNRFSII